MADSPGGAVGPSLYEERVGAVVLESAHASAQLLERIAWAVADAEAAEQPDMASASAAARSRVRISAPR